MNFHEHLSVFLSFSKKERRGIYLLLVISMLLWIFPVFFSGETIPDDILSITPLEISEAKQVLTKRNDSAKTNWNLNHSVYKNRSVGSPHAVDDTLTKHIYKKRFFTDRTKQPIDVNNADSIALVKLPGIGEKLSSRIIKYRDRLGGFINLSQLSEVYGLSDSTIRIITPLLFISEQFQPKKINVNSAEYKDLRRHPYITHAFAKSLLAYRKAHGIFQSLEDLKGILSLEHHEINKVSSYLTING